MVCEGVLHYLETSSEEIAEKTREQERQIYVPQIEKLTNNVNLLTDKIAHLEQLLTENNIAY